MKGLALAVLLGLLLGSCIGCSGHPHPDRTYHYDRTGALRGYHYPRNSFYRMNLKGPNVDNRKCQKPYWYNHSKCCERS